MWVLWMVVASANTELRRGEAIKLTAAEGTPGYAVALAFDVRITPTEVQTKWHGVSVDGSDNIDSDWSVKGYTATEIAVLDKDGSMVSLTPLPHGRGHETRRLARMQRFTLAGRPALMVTVDYSEPLGAYSGDAIFLYEIYANRLRYVSTTLPDGTQHHAISLMSSQKSGYRFMPDEKAPTEILTIETLDLPRMFAGTENVFTRISFDTAKQKWVRRERHVTPPLFIDLRHTDAEFERKNFD